MRIEDFRLGENPTGLRASARVVWEDVDRPPFEAFFESDGIATTNPRAYPNAFLTAAFVPAIRAGERRVRVEGAVVCPLLREGLRSASALLRQWSGPSVEPKIESPEGFRASTPSGPAALFLSGGADSLHLLQQNRSVYPDTHQNAFREAIHFLGMALFEDDPAEGARNLSERGLRSAQCVARSCGLTLRSVRSNVARLSGDHLFWASHTQGAMLASVALGQPIHSASLAASWDFRYLPPWGSHPFLDPCYSSSAVEIRHCGIGFSRLAKLTALGRWPVALENMIVCHQGPLPAGDLNCGRCEKCMRTMIELLIAGALDRATAFPVRRITGEMVDAIAPMPIPTERFWTDLPEPLEAIGRPDLARATKAFLARIRRQRRWESDRGWKGRLRRIDRAFLGGVILRLKQRATGGRRSAAPPS
jgi:hypothetical protein